MSVDQKILDMQDRIDELEGEILVLKAQLDHHQKSIGTLIDSLSKQVGINNSCFGILSKLIKTNSEETIDNELR